MMKVQRLLFDLVPLCHDCTRVQGGDKVPALPLLVALALVVSKLLLVPHRIGHSDENIEPSLNKMLRVREKLLGLYLCLQ